MSYYYSNEPKGSGFADGSSCHLETWRRSAFVRARRASVSPVRPGLLGVRAQRGQAERKGNTQRRHRQPPGKGASCRRKSPARPPSKVNTA